MSIFKRDQNPPGKQPAQVVGKQPVAPRSESTVRPISPSPVVPTPERVAASPVVPTPEPVAASPARPSTPPVKREAAAILDRNTFPYQEIQSFLIEQTHTAAIQNFQAGVVQPFHLVIGQLPKMRSIERGIVAL